jgi:hypothetical protein
VASLFTGVRRDAGALIRSYAATDRSLGNLTGKPKYTFALATRTFESPVAREPTFCCFCGTPAEIVTMVVRNIYTSLLPLILDHLHSLPSSYSRRRAVIRVLAQTYFYYLKVTIRKTMGRQRFLKDERREPHLHQHHFQACLKPSTLRTGALPIFS